MTRHHREGIRMAEMAVEKAVHARLKLMARKMIQDQAKEIETLESWRVLWANCGDKPQAETVAGRNAGL